MSSTALKLVPPVKPLDPPKSKMLTASMVREKWPETIRPSLRWVTENVPGKRKTAGKPWWWEHEVDEWLESLEAAS